MLLFQLPASRTRGPGALGSNGEVLSVTHNEDNGRFADYFIHLLLGIKLRDAPVGSTIWIQRI